MKRIISFIAIVLLGTLPRIQPVFAASCKVYAIESPKEDNYFNAKTGYAVKNAGYTPVLFKDLTDLKDKIAEHMTNQSCDCISDLILGGHGESGKFSVGCGAYKSCAKTEYIGRDNYAEWVPAMANIGTLMCNGLISEGIRLYGCQVGVCNEASQLLHDIAQVTNTPVHAPTTTVIGGKLFEEIQNNNWQIGLPNATARQPCKVGNYLNAPNRTRGANTSYQCPCSGMLYQDITTCTNSCTVSLGCFSNICTQVYINTYLDKSDGNPVLSGSSSSGTSASYSTQALIADWDAGGVSAPTVLRGNNEYTMWFTGYDATNTYWRIGMAKSSYADSWSQSAFNPVLTEGPAGSWDAGGVYNPSVIRDGSLYKMWYQGYSDTSRIGYAQSPDGINWSKHPTPVLDVGPAGSPDEIAAGEPTVIKTGNKYMMWYGCYDGWQWRICLATSSNGLDWTKQTGNPVLDVGPEWAWDEWYASAPSVVKLDTHYVMYYGGVDWYETDSIGRATSLDGIRWKKDSSNPILLPDSDKAWINRGVYHPTLLSDDNESLLKIWYRGKDSDENYTVGFASFPLSQETAPGKLFSWPMFIPAFTGARQQ